MSTKSRRILRRTVVTVFALILTLALVAAAVVFYHLGKPLPSHGGEHVIP